jgi:hypothetical protein
MFNWGSAAAPTHARESGTSIQRPRSSTLCCDASPGSVMSMARWMSIGQGISPRQARMKSSSTK